MNVRETVTFFRTRLEENPMTVLKTLLDARQGQTISFAYYGGENPGARRTVLVEEVKDDRIVGTDQGKPDGENIRQYLVDKAEGIRLEADAQPKPTPAEAACCVEVETPEVVRPGTRIRTSEVPFQDAREKLHDMVDDLSAEDLASMIADIEDADTGKFDTGSGMVVLETEVLVPHCKLNLTGETAGVDWVNEDGETITLVTSVKADENSVKDCLGDVVLALDGEILSAEDVLKVLAAHLGG